MIFVWIIYLATIAAVSAEWNVVISEYDYLDFLYRDGRNVSILQGRHRGVNSLAYDPIYENLYFSDVSNYQVAYIKMMEVTKEATVSLPYPIIAINSSNLYLFDLAHDPVTSSLFWTTTDVPYTQGQIWTAELGKNITYRPLISLKDQEPKGIVVDPCQGYVYWANGNLDSPSIDRMRLSDLTHETFLSNKSGHIFAPGSLSLSYSEKKLYWVDRKASIGYIARANLDGSNVETFLELTEGHEPNTLAVTEEAIYFTETDLDSVFLVRLDDPIKRIRRLNHAVIKPQGLAVRDQLAFLSRPDNPCPPLASLRQQVSPRENISVCLFGHISPPVNGIECSCWPGYGGTHCEISLCHNYCLQGGKCFLKDGQPTCDCPPSKKGSRCELESCSRECLNGGTLKCNGSSSGVCSCPSGFYGPSCEIPGPLCDLYCRYGEQVMMPNVFNCPCSLTEASIVPPKYTMHMAIGLIVSLCLLVLLIVALIIQTKRLKSRPRIFKRYSVTPKPATSPSCEIAIENCCNMNICETPCYEPDLRTMGNDRKKSKKEEKRGLLSEDVLASNCRSVPDF